MAAALKDTMIPMKKPAKEVLTPHRLALAILIKEFCIWKVAEQFDRWMIRNFCTLILNLIQSPDLSLDELRKVLVTEHQEHILKYDVLHKAFYSTIMNISKIGVRYLLDIVDSIGLLLPAHGESNITNDSGIVKKNSVIGYYLRRLVINFDKLTFSEIKTFFDSYQKYTSSSQNAKGDSAMEEQLDDWNQSNREWSRRQAELFIATQSALITNNEEKAMKPKKLHNNIKDLLKSNPDLSEAHFLNYLNFMRVKEYCGALDSLFNCFDVSAYVDSKNSEEKPKSYRYAALNLAILQYHFGHFEESLSALKEAIKMAQEANDNVCLQHSLAWMYCLTLPNRHKLMEHSIIKSLDLNLSYIMSLGIQSFIQYAGITMGNPKQVFDTITKSDIINCQHSHRDLISTSYSQKSAIWLFYGKSEMSFLWSQLLLYINTDNPSAHKTFYGEGYCQALCNIASLLNHEGEYGVANAVLTTAKERFPNEPISNVWILNEKVFNFEICLYNEQFLEAENTAGKIAVVDTWESCLRMTELLIHKRDYHEAHNCINQILGKCKNGTRKFRMDIQVRAMLLLSDIQIATSFPDSVIPGILGLLNSSLAYANDYNLQYLASLAQLRIAHVQLLMGMPAQALSMLDRCLVQILAHGGKYDRARANLLHVKCLVANAADKSETERNEIILNCAQMLDDVRKMFENVEAHFRVKDVLYLQAQLYNEIQCIEERNQCAMEYKALDEEYPTKNCYTLLTLL